MASSMAAEDDDTFFLKRLKFITDHQWVWNIKMTRFFSDNHITKIPLEWQKSLTSLKPTDISNNEPMSASAISPDSLVSNYVSTCHQLSVSVTVPQHVKTHEIRVNNDIARGMSPKKLHEVSRLAGLVKQVCQEMQCDSIIDIGSGLGYLGSCLVSQCGLRVLCVEGNKDRVDSATVREQKLLQSHDNHMTTVSMTLDSSSETRTNIAKVINDLSVPRVCMVGLHCCGDLTPILLDLLATPTHPALSSAIIVSCCYHKMSISDIEGQHLTNFPLSRSLKRTMESSKHGGVAQFNSFALRLAAQESYESWKSLSVEAHANHVKHVTYRAVLETLIEEAGVQLSGKAHRKANYDSSESYFKSLNLPGIGIDHALKRYLDYAHVSPIFEPFTAIQYHMQRVLETVILMDRVVYLRESGLYTVELVPVFNVDISPRTLAIVAKRKL